MEFMKILFCGIAVKMANLINFFGFDFSSKPFKDNLK